MCSQRTKGDEPCDASVICLDLNIDGNRTHGITDQPATLSITVCPVCVVGLPSDGVMTRRAQDEQRNMPRSANRSRLQAAESLREALGGDERQQQFDYSNKSDDKKIINKWAPFYTMAVPVFSNNPERKKRLPFTSFAYYTF